MSSVINTEDDTVNFKENCIKCAIKNNEPIEEKLNVIIVISNPCMYSRRIVLLKEFVKRIEMEEEHVNLFIVEMIYSGGLNDSCKPQEFTVTDSTNPNHLQLIAPVPLWHKENMVNMGVKYLLPKDYKAFAWIDADVEFDSPTWAMDTLKILNGCKDIVQLWSHAVFMSRDEMNLELFNSFGYRYVKDNKRYKYTEKDYWHPGFAWAMTRTAYEQLGGLYDKGIVGSGDSIFTHCLMKRIELMQQKKYHADYNKSMDDYQIKASNLSVGYVPGVIRHHFHGSRTNRKYVERWQILISNQYSPINHLTYDDGGILIPSTECPPKLLTDIMNYFVERKEDD
jgi:hypothetical protein